MKVIAEIGSNWKTFSDCLDSIDMAKKFGADVVKFQYYNHLDLYGEAGSLRCQPELLPLSVRAEIVGIEFMCTAFSPSGYGFVDTMVKRHKVASSEITALNILETVASFKKPVLLSTGGALVEQIDQALDILQGCEVTLMYCVAEYPARIVDFRHLTAMKERYGSRCAIGYSDHSDDVLNVPTLARDLGSVVIEKHVNFTEHKDTPDAPHSLSPHEFDLMVKHLKGEATVADTFRPNPHKRRLITRLDGSSGFFRPMKNVG